MVICRAHFSFPKVYRYVVLFKIIFWLNIKWRLSFSQDEQVKATLKNGLLTVTFPKTLPELAPKKIVIQTSEKDEYETDF